MLDLRSWSILGLLPAVLGLPHQYRFDRERRLGTQAHRGGAGMRAEESLHVSCALPEYCQSFNRFVFKAFAYAMVI